MTITLAIVPSPGICRSGIQVSSTANPVMITIVPNETGTSRASPKCRTSHGSRPRNDCTSMAMLTPYSTSPARSWVSRRGIRGLRICCHGVRLARESMASIMSPKWPSHPYPLLRQWSGGHLPLRPPRRGAAAAVRRPHAGVRRAGRRSAPADRRRPHPRRHPAAQRARADRRARREPDDRDPGLRRPQGRRLPRWPATARAAWPGCPTPPARATPSSARRPGSGAATSST